MQTPHDQCDVETFSSQNDMSKLRVKFIIDKEQQRVIFAEAGSDFVDVLLSFLTLPLGRIVRILGKKSGLGSLDSLYKSVEMLDEKYLQTKACKEMLLNPRSAAELLCEDLKIKNIHHSNPREVYVCDSRACFSQKTHSFTFCENVKCSRCGSLMAEIVEFKAETSLQGGVFVLETIDFLVTDSLMVMPISSKEVFSLLKDKGIEDASMLETRVIDFGTEEMLNLLKKSLVSKNPLTEVCFPDSTCVQASVNCSLAIKEELNVKEEVSETTLKLILNKKKNEVIYAEVGERFANQLLSFLAFPLGSVLRLLSDNVLELSGCISNLYSSVENMSLDCFQHEKCRKMLLTPKLATFHGFEQQILNLKEASWEIIAIQMSCSWCYFDGTLNHAFDSCKHKLDDSDLIQQNPKSQKTSTDYGGAYVSNTIRCMVADDLHVSPLSFISSLTNDRSLLISDIVEKDVCLDKAKALSLLSTLLITSNTSLTNVFCSKPCDFL